MAGKAWTYDEVKLAYFLYCQLSFGQLDSRNPDVKELARLLGRTPGSVAMKLVNLASLDQNITSTGRSGLKNASRLDRSVWEEFKQHWNVPIEEAIVKREQLRLAAQPIAESRLQEASQNSNHVLQISEPAREVMQDADYSANNRVALVLQREKQSFFRRAVLSAYRHRCCMTGLAEPKLLNASHIIAWSEDPKNRLNPANGLCLSALHDRAFDQHLISLDEQFRIIVSRRLKRQHRDDAIKRTFLDLEEKQIELPERFTPNAAFLERHREVMAGHT